jgi:hypothetical protein
LPELELPPDGTIRRWLGAASNGCQRRALLETVSDTDLAARQIGVNDAYEDEEVFVAVRAFADELDHAPSVTRSTSLGTPAGGARAAGSAAPVVQAVRALRRLPRACA